MTSSPAVVALALLALAPVISPVTTSFLSRPLFLLRLARSPFTLWRSALVVRIALCRLMRGGTLLARLTLLLDWRGTPLRRG